MLREKVHLKPNDIIANELIAKETDSLWNNSASKIYSSFVDEGKSAPTQVILEQELVPLAQGNKIYPESIDTECTDLLCHNTQGSADKYAESLHNEFYADLEKASSKGLSESDLRRQKILSAVYP